MVIIITLIYQLQAPQPMTMVT